MNRRLDLLVPAAMALTVVAFFWKLLTKQYTWMDHPDMVAQILPWLQYQAASWHAGHWFPLWDPNTWAGQPLIGQIVPGAAYPLNWPLFLLPFGADGRIQPMFLHIQFIFSHVLAAIFCYRLCRDLGRTHAASALAGLAFSLSGMVGGWAWPQMLNSSIWMPLVAMYFHRGVRRTDFATGNAALCGFFLGVMFLGGHHQIPVLFALLMGGMWTVRLWMQRFTAVLPAAAFAAMTLLTAGLQLLPTLEYGARSIRWVGTRNPVFWGQSVPYIVHQDYEHSFFPSSLLGLVLPNLSPQFTAFLGLTVVLVALTGVAYGYRRFNETRFIGLVFIAATLYAFGGFSVFHGAAYLFIPTVEKARSPGMAFCIAQFAVVVLAAYGVDAIRESADAVPRRWLRLLTGLGVIAWIAVAIGASVRMQASNEYERPVLFGLMAFALVAILNARRSGAMAVPTVIGALLLAVVFEAGTVTGRDYRHRESPGGFLHEFGKHREVADFLKSQSGPVRVEYNPADDIRYNMGDWDGVPQFESYLAGLTANIGRLKAPDELDSALPKIFALTHYAGMEPKRRSTQEEVFRSKSGVRVFRNTDAHPRAWIVHRTVRATKQDLVQTLGRVDLGRMAVLVDAAPPQLEACDDAGPVAITRYEPDVVEYAASLSCKGMIVMSETWFPGWTATVDGAPTPVYEVDGAIRGVVVNSAGAHKIVLRYRPTSVYAGAVMSLAGALTAIFLFWRQRRR